MNMTTQPVVVAVSVWRYQLKIIEINSQIISYLPPYRASTSLRFHPLVVTTIPYDFTVLECKIHFLGRWTEPMPRMHGVCYHGHGRLPTALPLHPRLLRRNEHENRSANSHASSWKTGTKWSYCWGEACKRLSFTLSSFTYKAISLISSFSLQGFHHMPETRGLCLSEEQTVTSVRFRRVAILFIQNCRIAIRVYIGIELVLVNHVQILKRPRIGGHRLVGMRTQPQKLIRRCEVTAILVLYGLPR